MENLASCKSLFYILDLIPEYIRHYEYPADNCLTIYFFEMVSRDNAQIES